MQADRVTDALFIAALGGSELLQRAQDELMKRQPRPYMQVIRAVMKSDILGACLNMCLAGAYAPTLPSPFPGRAAVRS